MVKIVLQTISQVEVDTDTGKQRLIKAFTKVLGKGNGPKKPKQLKISSIEEDEM